MAEDPRPIFYLAPHADDVALSCAGSVLLDTRAGRPVTLLTVFLSGAQAGPRRAEDEAAARVLGCRYLSLDLFDAPDRPEVRGLLGVFSRYGPAHLGITNEVVERLRWHVRPGAVLRAPLALGGHIDHRIVHEAARALAYDLELPIGYYEDLPYGLARHALGRRLAAVGAKESLHALPGCERAPRSEELAALRAFHLGLPLAGWEALPGVVRWIPGLRRVGAELAARAMLAADEGGQRPGFPPRLEPKLLEVPGREDPARLAALAAYASQWPMFANSAEALLEKLLGYGASLGPSGSVCERIWLDRGIRPAAASEP
jgi:LmbE family N-acetylglucosaminyl deacetylase